MLCNSGSGPEIGLPGQILAGLLPGKRRNRPSGRPEGRFRCLPGSSPAKIRPGSPIYGPEALLRNRKRGAMLAHRTRKHGHRIAARLFIGSGFCPGCRFDHHSRVRCLRHVQRSPACRDFLEIGSVPSLSLEEVSALDLADRALRKQAKRAGRSEFAGPPAVFAG